VVKGFVSCFASVDMRKIVRNEDDVKDRSKVTRLLQIVVFQWRWRCLARRVLLCLT